MYIYIYIYLLLCPTSTIDSHTMGMLDPHILILVKNSFDLLQEHTCHMVPCIVDTYTQLISAPSFDNEVKLFSWWLLKLHTMRISHLWVPLLFLISLSRGQVYPLCHTIRFYLWHHTSRASWHYRHHIMDFLMYLPILQWCWGSTDTSSSS